MARGPGAVGCAHCTKLGAHRACSICTRLVCDTCAEDWATCSEPAGRLIRLGRTARLRDVDPSGRLGLVSHWRHALRVFDLRRLRWIERDLPRGMYLWNRRTPPRLTGDGRAIHALWSAGTGYESSDALQFAGMAVDELGTLAREVVSSEAPEHGTAVTATGDLFYFVTNTQRVAIIDGTRAYAVEPLPRKVVQAVHLDADRALLASASWNELALHRLVDGKLELLGRCKTATSGDVKRLGLAGEWLVAQVETSGGGGRLEVYRPDATSSIGAVVHEQDATGVQQMALSRDGRFVALALDTQLQVVELGTDHVETFDEHTDTINLVRFAHDHLLISADADNRVVMRPRTGAGHARALVTIEIPRDPVPLPT